MFKSLCEDAGFFITLKLTIDNFATILTLKFKSKEAKCSELNSVCNVLVYLSKKYLIKLHQQCAFILSKSFRLI